MTRLFFVVVLSFALAANGQDTKPADAPVVTTLTEKEVDLLNRRLLRLEAESKTCKEELAKAPILPVWASVVIGVVAVGVGVAAGYGVAQAVKNPGQGP